MKESMKRIKEFDRRLIGDDDMAPVRNGGSYLILIFATALLSIRASNMRQNYRFIFISAVLMALGMALLLKPYVLVIEDGENSSVYKKLSCMPVSKMDVFKCRFGYLNKYCLILIVILAVFHCIGVMAFHLPILYNWFNILVCLGITWLSGLEYIRPR